MPSPTCLRDAAHRAGRRSLRLLLPVLLLALGACYRYVPITSGNPPISSEFRAELTEDGIVRMAPTLGGQYRLVEGRLTSANDSAYVLTVMATFDRAMQQTYWNGESITLPRPYVQRVEARELNRRRTWLVVAAGLVGGFLAARIFDIFGGAADQTGPGGPGGPPPV